MTDVTEADGFQPDKMVNVRAGDLDNLTAVAQAALLAANRQLEEREPY